MAILASDQITLTCTVSVEATWRYYKLQSSTQAKPSAPTTNPPTGWTDTEPTYVEGSTNTLYFVDLTEFSDGTWNYSNVSVSSSYEAAKTAYNKAVNALSTAKEANDKILAWCHDNNKTLIDGAKIYTGSITSLQIASNAITAEKIAAKAITTEKLDVDKLSAISSNLGSITAGSINIGNGKFVVTSDGVLTAKSGTFEGKVTSKSGSIAGITINEGDLSASTTSGGITNGFSLQDDGIIHIYNTGSGTDYHMYFNEGILELTSYGSFGGTNQMSSRLTPRGLFFDDALEESSVNSRAIDIYGKVFLNDDFSLELTSGNGVVVSTGLYAESGLYISSGDLEVKYNTWLDGSLRVGGKLRLGKYIDDSHYVTSGIEVQDLRNVNLIPSMFGDTAMNVFFCNLQNRWNSVMHLKGWAGGDYATHQLFFNAGDMNDQNIYHRCGTDNAGWGNLHALLDTDNYKNYVAPRLETTGYMTTYGYYRIATIYNPVHGLSAILTINTTYSYVNNSSVTLLISATYYNGSITVLGKCENWDLITGIRLVADGSSKIHVMYYYNYNNPNNVYCDFIVLGAHSSARLEVTPMTRDDGEYDGVIASLNP